MGITTTNAADAIQQLTARGNINLNTLLDLGLASSKTAAGVTALTRSTADLDAAQARAADSAGKVAEGLDKIEHTPGENLAKLSASFKDLAVNSGAAHFLDRFVIGLTKANTEASNNISLLKQQALALKAAQQAQSSRHRLTNSGIVG